MMFLHDISMLFIFSIALYPILTFKIFSINYYEAGLLLPTLATFLMFALAILRIFHIGCFSLKYQKGRFLVYWAINALISFCLVLLMDYGISIKDLSIEEEALSNIVWYLIILILVLIYGLYLSNSFSKARSIFSSVSGRVNSRGKLFF